MRDVIAGLGCRRDCPAADIVALVRAAAAQADCAVTAIAIPLTKIREPGLQEAAASLGLPLIPVAADALAAVQAQCVTRSACAERALGVASVAEGCALAATGAAALLLPRIASSRATCALAVRP
jgi:cobalt-precorrin 5A hydrolase